MPSDLPLKERMRKRVVFKRLCNKNGLHVQRFVGCDGAAAERLRKHFQPRCDAIAKTYWGVPWQEAVPPETTFDHYLPPEQHAPVPPDVAQRIVRKVLAAKAQPPKRMMPINTPDRRLNSLVSWVTQRA